MVACLPFAPEPEITGFVRSHAALRGNPRRPTGDVGQAHWQVAGRRLRNVSRVPFLAIRDRPPLVDEAHRRSGRLEPDKGFWEGIRMRFPRSTSGRAITATAVIALSVTAAVVGNGWRHRIVGQVPDIATPAPAELETDPRQTRGFGPPLRQRNRRSGLPPHSNRGRGGTGRHTARSVAESRR